MSPPKDTWDVLIDGPNPNAAVEEAVNPQLLSAMMTRESEVELPGRVRLHSVTGNLIGLPVGESFIKAMEIPAGTTLTELQANANGWKEKLRQSVNSSIRHAKAYDNRQFTMETALVTYTSGRVFIQVAVTRIA